MAMLLIAFSSVVPDSLSQTVLIRPHSFNSSSLTKYCYFVGVIRWNVVVHTGDYKSPRNYFLKRQVIDLLGLSNWGFLFACQFEYFVFVCIYLWLWLHVWALDFSLKVETAVTQSSNQLKWLPCTAMPESSSVPLTRKLRTFKCDDV